MNMTKLILPIVSIIGITLLAGAQPANYPPSAKESIEWCDLWISHANETNLPRVLLIGDSISRDYYPGVEKRLAGKAYVARLSTSAFISDPVLLQEIKMVLGEYKCDVIHFNNGMHGWQNSEKEYQQAFPKFLTSIQKYAPGAKLIWATTTPLKVSPKLPLDNQTEATDERIARRNAIALKVVEAESIPVDDLNALVQGHPEYHSDNVHFNSQGIDLEAAQVAAQIEPQLKN